MTGVSCGFNFNALPDPNNADLLTVQKEVEVKDAEVINVSKKNAGSSTSHNVRPPSTSQKLKFHQLRWIVKHID